MLSDAERQFLEQQRVGHLATADLRGVPHVVPVCFATLRDSLYITIDEKPKRSSPFALRRLRNIAANPAVAIVVDRYSEDWTWLGWVMLHGRAEILSAGAEHRDAQELLRARYPHRARAGGRDGGGARVQSLRRRGVVGAEDERRRADRDRDDQRFAHRAAVAG